MPLLFIGALSMFVSYEFLDAYYATVPAPLVYKEIRYANWTFEEPDRFCITLYAKNENGFFCYDDYTLAMAQQVGPDTVANYVGTYVVSLPLGTQSYTGSQPTPYYFYAFFASVSFLTGLVCFYFVLTYYAARKQIRKYTLAEAMSIMHSIHADEQHNATCGVVTLTLRSKANLIETIMDDVRGRRPDIEFVYEPGSPTIIETKDGAVAEFTSTIAWYKKDEGNTFTVMDVSHTSKV